MTARLFTAAAGVALLSACASQGVLDAQRVDALLPADAVLIGEQHDAPDHQRIHQAVIVRLASRSTLAAVALEMADQGVSTAGLDRSATEDSVRSALHWNDALWNWSAYGPPVMAAVRAGVPVLGANLPREKMAGAMSDKSLDRLLPGPALKAQQQLIRHSHCDALPESQILPMTRIQVARDVAMAQTLAGAAVAGHTVLLLAGSGHVDRQLGIPQHLPRNLKSKSVLLIADKAQEATKSVADFDQAWVTLPAPAKDYCAEFRIRLKP